MTTTAYKFRHRDPNLGRSVPALSMAFKYFGEHRHLGASSHQHKVKSLALCRLSLAGLARMLQIVSAAEKTKSAYSTQIRHAL